MKTDNFKIGDILCASDNTIFMFAGVKDAFAKFYCALDNDNSLLISDGTYLWEDESLCKYATEEQKNQLMNALNSAGYFWNNTKNKLEKR